MKKWLRRLALGSLAGLILFVGVTFGRLQWTKVQINREKDGVMEIAPLEIGETSRLEILPLYEKSAQEGLQSGHGVSYLIRTDDATILFDLGNNMTAASPSPLLQNMEALGVSMEEIDTIIISHRHPDHVGGQNWWTERTFSLDGLMQPSFGNIPVYIPEEMTYPDSDLLLAENPIVLSKGVATTGLISYAQPFPVWLAVPSGEEQALAVNVTGKGLILITGCGHMGLESLLARAKAVFDTPVVGVVGGLHYGNTDMAALQDEVRLLDRLNPFIVALSPHDSSATVLEGFEQEFQEVYEYISVGKSIVIVGADVAP